MKKRSHARVIKQSMSNSRPFAQRSKGLVKFDVAVIGKGDKLMKPCPKRSEVTKISAEFCALGNAEIMS